MASLSKPALFVCQSSCVTVPECAAEPVLPLSSGAAALSGGLLATGGKDGVGRQDPSPTRPTVKKPDPCIVSFACELGGNVLGPALRTGEVVHFLPEEAQRFETVTLSLHCNGFSTKGTRSVVVTWSPFSLVQACRFHSVEADQALPWLRLFKVSVFQHGRTHFFASQGQDADTERARWVADIARAVRLLTQSLFPKYDLSTDPIAGCEWTRKRLLAGYLLLCDDQGVSLVFCELHAPWDGVAMFTGYDNESCQAQVIQASLDANTCVSERVGVDCSCFSFDNYHFTTRSSAEKMLWLRAISNVKVKLRHRAPNPTFEEMDHYRISILEYARNVQPADDDFTRLELLPRRTRFVHKTYLSHQEPKHSVASQMPAVVRSNPCPSAGDSDVPKLQELRRPLKLSLTAEQDDLTPPPVPDGQVFEGYDVDELVNTIVPQIVDAGLHRLLPEKHTASPALRMNPTVQVSPKLCAPSPDLPKVGFATLPSLPGEASNMFDAPPPGENAGQDSASSETAPPDAAAGPTVAGAPATKLQRA